MLVAPRANWKGYLKIAELTCPVALYPAVSTSERIAFQTVNRETGHRVKRQYIDSETEEPVEPENQVKGYETGKDEYVVIEPYEIAAAIPESDKTLTVDAFIRSAEIDDVYLDQPYYLAPANAAATEVFALIREALNRGSAAAIAHTVLFRRLRTLLVRPYGRGLVAATLYFDYEVRSATEAFDEIAEIDITGEMLDLAEHIMSTKKGTFEPQPFTDRYEAALAELVRAKLEGKPLPEKKVPAAAKVIDLMDALRKSAAVAGRPGPRDGKDAPRKGKAASESRKSKSTTKPSPRRKAG